MLFACIFVDVFFFVVAVVFVVFFFCMSCALSSQISFRQMQNNQKLLAHFHLVFYFGATKMMMMTSACKMQITEKLFFEMIFFMLFLLFHLFNFESSCDLRAQHISFSCCTKSKRCRFCQLDTFNSSCDTHTFVSLFISHTQFHSTPCTGSIKPHKLTRHNNLIHCVGLAKTMGLIFSGHVHTSSSFYRRQMCICGCA